MVRLFFQVVAALALVADSEENDPLCSRIPEHREVPHGKPFSDVNYVTPAWRIVNMTFYKGERFHGMEYWMYNNATKATQFFFHGSVGKHKDVICLDQKKDEHFTTLQVGYGKHDGHTRATRAQITTNLGYELISGIPKDDRDIFQVSTGEKILGFGGKKGQEIDLLYPIYLPEKCKSQ